MKEFIEKLIGRLEELYDRNDKTKKIAYEEQDWEKFDLFTHRCEGIYSAIAIVNQLAEEYINTSTDTSTTNADRIRSMTDEELAEFLYDTNHYFENGEYLVRFGGEIVQDEEINILDWLKSEVEGVTENE
jgi:hypothetical protein